MFNYFKSFIADVHLDGVLYQGQSPPPHSKSGSTTLMHHTAKRARYWTELRFSTDAHVSSICQESFPSNEYSLQNGVSNAPSSQCPFRPVSTTCCWVSSPQKHELWTHHPTSSSNAMIASPTPQQHDPEALLLGLLRVCAATTPAMACPSNSPGPQDPHSLLQRLIHAEAAAAALRQQASAQVRGWWV
jgi:hypothetical protein